jgi:hypothetical protein
MSARALLTLLDIDCVFYTTVATVAVSDQRLIAEWMKNICQTTVIIGFLRDEVKSAVDIPRVEWGENNYVCPGLTHNVCDHPKNLGHRKFAMSLADKTNRKMSASSIYFLADD